MVGISGRGHGSWIPVLDNPYCNSQPTVHDHPVHGNVTQNLAVELRGRNVAPPKTQVISQQRKFFEKSLNRWPVSPWFWGAREFFFRKILRILKPFAQKRATTLSTQRWSFKEKGFFENKACGMLIDLHEALTWTSTTSHCSSDEVFVCI